MENKNFVFAEQKNEIPVVITYAYNYADIADGRDDMLCWVTEEEYKKIQAYYAHPYAHYIGVMINFELPRIKEMVQDQVGENVKDVFIEEIRMADEDGMLFDYDEESEVPEQSDIPAIDNDPLPF